MEWPYPFRRQDVCDKGWKVAPVHWGSFPVKCMVLPVLHIVTFDSRVKSLEDAPVCLDSWRWGSGSGMLLVQLTHIAISHPFLDFPPFNNQTLWVCIAMWDRAFQFTKQPCNLWWIFPLAFAVESQSIVFPNQCNSQRLDALPYSKTQNISGIFFPARICLLSSPPQIVCERGRIHRHLKSYLSFWLIRHQG